MVLSVLRLFLLLYFALAHIQEFPYQIICHFAAPSWQVYSFLSSFLVLRQMHFFFAFIPARGKLSNRKNYAHENILGTMIANRCEGARKNSNRKWISNYFIARCRYVNSCYYHERCGLGKITYRLSTSGRTRVVWYLQKSVTSTKKNTYSCTHTGPLRHRHLLESISPPPQRRRSNNAHRRKCLFERVSPCTHFIMWLCCHRQSRRRKKHPSMPPPHAHTHISEMEFKLVQRTTPNNDDAKEI